MLKLLPVVTSGS